VVACMLQILGISWAVTIAAIEIESVVVTSPILSLLGIVVAIGPRRSRSIFKAAFGLSTLALSVGVAVWISTQSLDPSKAQLPVTAALISYELAFIPLGWLAVYQTLSLSELGSSQATRGQQFSIAQLLVVTAWVAVALGIGKAMIDGNRNAQILVATSVCVLTSLGIGIAAAKGLTFLQGTGESDPITSAK